MKSSIKPENTIFFSKSEWQSTDNIAPKINEITLGCYNVLFPSRNFFKKIITSDNDRYNYQISELLPEANIDILALSEVTEDYINILLNSSWIQKEYYIFNPKKKVFRNGFGNIILSKYPMRCYSMDSVIYGRIAIGLISPLKEIESSFLIISTHLIALDKNFEIRRKQLERMLEELNFYSDKEDPFLKHFQSAVKNRNIIIMGDLNFHLKKEDMTIFSNNLIDLWAETNKDFEGGYSWDSRENTFINFIYPFDRRRMRLDRILFTEGSKLFDISEEKMTIFGKNKVFPFKKLSFLRGSDHFGLKVKIKLLQYKHENGYYRKIPMKNELEFEGKKLF